MKANILSIAAGKAKTYTKGDDEFQSAYRKDLFFNFIELNDLGIVEDYQCDKRYHGGEDKALHIGSSKHFENFRNLYGKDMDHLSMGCNIIIDNLDENDICIGDIYAIGDITIQVTQPRQPCWKIGALFGKEASRYIVKNHATGWYARVLCEGIIDKNDEMILEERVSPVTIKNLSTYLHNPPLDKDLIENLFSMPFLAKAYKNDLQKAIDKFVGEQP